MAKAEKKLMYLFSQIGTDFNKVEVTQVQAAIALGMNRQNVNRAYKTLLVMGVLVELEKVGVVKQYRINGAYVFRPPVDSSLRQLVHEVSQVKLL